MKHPSQQTSHRRRLSARIAVATLSTMILLGPVRLRAGESAPDIEPILHEMAANGREFNPEKLQKMGRRGLSALLDNLLPETAQTKGPTISRDDVLRLLRELGDNYFQTRERAMARLIEVGQPFEGLVTNAAKDDDLEVRIRAKSVLSAWQKVREGAKTRNVGRYAKAFSVFVDRLADEECLLELARRTRLALEKGWPAAGKRRILEHCLGALARTGNDKYCDILKPLLKHKDVNVAVGVTRTLGSRSGNRYFPSLLIDALQTEREAVVDAAMAWAPNCWSPRRREVGRLLRKIFGGENETLKFQACFPLMHGHGDPRAVAYLLSQTGSKDAARARRATSWIGDSCNSGKKAYPELLKALVPLLRSEDNGLRRCAADALGTYSGEDVVKNLIPLLGDKQAIIVSETSRNLLDQRDKSMLRRLLTDAKAKAENELIRKQAGELLEKLQKPPAPRAPAA